MVQPPTLCKSAPMEVTEKICGAVFLLQDTFRSSTTHVRTILNAMLQFDCRSWEIFFCESIVDQLFCRHFHATTTQVRRVQKAHRKQVLSVSHTLNQVLKDVFVQCGQRQIHIFFFKLTEELLSMCIY